MIGLYHNKWGFEVSVFCSNINDMIYIMHFDCSCVIIWLR